MQKDFFEVYLVSFVCRCFTARSLLLCWSEFPGGTWGGQRFTQGTEICTIDSKHRVEEARARVETVLEQLMYCD
jgi:hypothetical protein